MTKTLFIPARSREIALKVAYAVEAGKVPCLGQYLDQDRARYSAEKLTELHHELHRVFTVVIETKTHDDGRIPVARIIDDLGSLAAALLLVVGGAAGGHCCDPPPRHSRACQLQRLAHAPAGGQGCCSAQPPHCRFNP